MVSEVLLSQYHVLRDTDNIELRHLFLDLQNAMEAAELNDLERTVIDATYLRHPKPPLRVNRPGRPKGGHTQHTIVLGLLDALRQEPRQRVFSSRRISEYNAVRRSTYWYKKVLRRALSKIDQALNYEDVHDLSPQAVCNLYSRHTRQRQVMY